MDGECDPSSRLWVAVSLISSPTSSSITLVGEADRKMLKAAIKQSSTDQIRHRVIPPDAIAQTAEQLENLRSEVSEVLKEEKEEKAVSRKL